MLTSHAILAHLCKQGRQGAIRPSLLTCDAGPCPAARVLVAQRAALALVVGVGVGRIVVGRDVHVAPAVLQVLAGVGLGVQLRLLPLRPSLNPSLPLSHGAGPLL